ncbi:hypothetical protein D3C87_1823230 [compost metagenome]
MSPMHLRCGTADRHAAEKTLASEALTDELPLREPSPLGEGAEALLLLGGQIEGDVERHTACSLRRLDTAHCTKGSALYQGKHIVTIRNIRDFLSEAPGSPPGASLRKRASRVRGSARAPTG